MHLLKKGVNIREMVGRKFKIKSIIFYDCHDSTKIQKVFDLLDLLSELQKPSSRAYNFLRKQHGAKIN